MKGHSAALYTVQVKVKRREEYRLFGDLNGQGAYLGEAIVGYTYELDVQNPDTTGRVRVRRASLEEADDEVFIVVTHGQSGVVGDIVDEEDNLKTHQEETDSQNVMGAALLRLPRNGTLGWLCVHVNNRRSCKTLLTNAIKDRLREDYRWLMLEVVPAQIGGAFRAAVNDGRIDEVKLVRLERVGDRANASTDKWVPGGVDAKLELDITAQHGIRITPTLIQRFLGGDPNAFGEILLFEGMTFDEAKVRVGTRRWPVADLQHRNAGGRPPDHGVARGPAHPGRRRRAHGGVPVGRATAGDRGSDGMTGRWRHGQG